MKLDKKGSVNEQTIEKWIFVFILILILFNVIADLFPDVTAAADTLNTSGFPLASFFMTDGVLWYLVAAGLLFMLYKSFKMGKK